VLRTDDLLKIELYPYLAKMSTPLDVSELQLHPAVPVSAPLAIILIPVLILVFVLYRRALPTPVAGIPYNGKFPNILGDFLEIVNAVKNEGGAIKWIID
jgi:hypothetical protein